MHSSTTQSIFQNVEDHAASEHSHNVKLTLFIWTYAAPMVIQMDVTFPAPYMYDNCLVCFVSYSIMLEGWIKYSLQMVECTSHDYGSTNGLCADFERGYTM
jgi:hypothetical protein